MHAQQVSAPATSGLPPAASLRPGGALHLRRLAAADLPAIEVHLLALSPADRHARFHALLGDEAIRAYAGRVDFARMILVGAFEPASRRLLGLAEAHLDEAAAPRRAEVSVSLLPEQRGQALGRRLVAASLDEAAARGARFADFYYQAGNRAVARLVRALAAPIAAAPGHASLALPLAANENAGRTSEALAS